MIPTEKAACGPPFFRTADTSARPSDAEGFIGVTKLNYNLTPAVAVSGAFDAWRFFLGGAVSGIWHDGGWCPQPSILGAAQGSGQLGGGIAMQLDDGFYLRVQASYDSFFVPGLDAWSGRLRAGKTF